MYGFDDTSIDVSDTITRVAILHANDGKCFYCGEPVRFVDLQLEHVIPKNTPPAVLDSLRQRGVIPPGFSVSSVGNIVPSHHSCNNPKGDQLYGDEQLILLLGSWARKGDRVATELNRARATRHQDKVLSELASLVQMGKIDPKEVAMVVRDASPKTAIAPTEPWLVTFSFNCNADDFHVPAEAEGTYVHMCDWLESMLWQRLQGGLAQMVQQAQPSERDGEVCSTRYAFWGLDFERLSQLDLSPWEILEICNWSDLYDEYPSWLMDSAIIDKYHELARDPEDPKFGLRRCPSCGSSELRKRQLTDWQHDEVYYIVDCQDCGWGDWTQ